MYFFLLFMYICEGTNVTLCSFHFTLFTILFTLCIVFLFFSSSFYYHFFYLSPLTPLLFSHEELSSDRKFVHATLRNWQQIKHPQSTQKTFDLICSISIWLIWGTQKPPTNIIFWVFLLPTYNSLYSMRPKRISKTLIFSLFNPLWSMIKVGVCV